MNRKFFALALALVMALSLAACGGSGDSGSGGGDASGKAGTYEGVGEGRNGDITVNVTLDDAGAITAIEVVSQEETEGVGTPAFDALIPVMVEQNTSEVDGLAGATLTSDGLKQAVADALSKAG